MGEKAKNNSIFCYSRLLLGNELCGLDLKTDQSDVQVSRITGGVYPSSCGFLYIGNCWTEFGRMHGGKNESFLRVYFQYVPYDPQ